MIPVARLNRNTREDSGIYGMISINNKAVCLTLENSDVSIPADVYRCVKDNTGKHRWWRLEDRYGRTLIEIHIGNTEDKSEGCILFGSVIGEINGQKGLLSSGVALDRFLRELEGHTEFDLVITDCY